MNPPVILFPFGEYWWFYAAFPRALCVLLALDLGVFHRKAHAVSIREAAAWSVVWVSLALALQRRASTSTALAFPADPRLAGHPGLRPVGAAWQAALEFLTGYVVEYSLSVDNIFVFVVVLEYFGVPSQLPAPRALLRHPGRARLPGDLHRPGRALMQFHWVVWLFGAFLVFTGVQMMAGGGDGPGTSRTRSSGCFRQIVPVTDDFHGQNFFVREDGVLHATPLLRRAPLPRDDATSCSPSTRCRPSSPSPASRCVVFTSNIFAILGLRSLYFMLAGAVDKFHLLKYGLGDRAGLRRPQDGGAQPSLRRPFPHRALPRHHRRRDRRLDRPVAALPEEGPGGASLTIWTRIASSRRSRPRARTTRSGTWTWC